MYSNIDLDHARSVMKNWCESYDPEPGDDWPPVDTILAALDIVMRFNIMQFGDSYFIQLVGTAMGTSCAVIFANLYFGAHEKRSILPRFQDNLKRIFFYRRFIDDVFFIWLGEMDAAWDELVTLFNNFGILKWDIEEPQHVCELPWHHEHDRRE